MIGYLVVNVVLCLFVAVVVLHRGHEVCLVVVVMLLLVAVVTALLLGRVRVN